jgi:hypothetical protein
MRSEEALIGKKKKQPEMNRPKQLPQTVKRKGHGGDRTHNLLVRSQTPCHLATRPMLIDDETVLIID